MAPVCDTPGCTNKAGTRSSRCTDCRAAAARERRVVVRRRNADVAAIDRLLSGWIRQDGFRKLIAEFICDQHHAELEGQGDQYATKTLLDASMRDPNLALHRKVWSNPGGQG